MLLGLLLIVLLASALRFFQLEDDGLWLDEIFTHFDATKLPLSRLIRGGQLVSNLNHPPFYFLLAHFAWKAAPFDIALRFPATMAGILCVPAISLLAATLFRRKDGVVAALIFTISPVAIYYSQEARSYTMIWLFSLLSAWAFWRALYSHKARWWLAVFFLNLLGLYTNYTQFLIVLAEVAFLALWLLARLSEEAKRALLYFAGTLFAMLLIASLGGLDLIGNVTRTDPQAGSLQDKIFQQTLPSARAAFVWLHLYDNTLAGVLFVAMMVLAVLQGLLARRGWQVLFLLILMFVPIALIIISNPPYTNTIYPRYFFYALPFYLILVSRGLIVLQRWIQVALSRMTRRAKPEHSRLSGGLWAGLLGMVLVLHVPALQSYYADVPGYMRLRPEWKEAVSVIQEDGGVNPLIITVDPETELSFNRYMPTQRVDSLEALQAVMAQGQRGYIVHDSYHPAPPWAADNTLNVVEGLEEMARFAQVIVYRFNNSTPP